MTGLHSADRLFKILEYGLAVWWRGRSNMKATFPKGQAQRIDQMPLS
jgi:hypothetical protein